MKKRNRSNYSITLVPILLLMFLSSVKADQPIYARPGGFYYDIAAGNYLPPGVFATWTQVDAGTTTPGTATGTHTSSGSTYRGGSLNTDGPNFVNYDDNGYDTSIGVGNEGESEGAGTPPWTQRQIDGEIPREDPNADYQFIQHQVFGNRGTNVDRDGGGNPLPPDVEGYRFYNFGSDSQATPNAPAQNTNPGDNFPRNVLSTRQVELDHWNNPSPDDVNRIVGIGQTVLVPVSATISYNGGYGIDELKLRIIGGNDGGISGFKLEVKSGMEVRVEDFTLADNGDIFGNDGLPINELTYVTYTDVNDAGSGVDPADGNTREYTVPVGQGNGADANIINNGGVTFRSDGESEAIKDGVDIGEPTNGLASNEIGTAIDGNYDVLADLLSDIATFQSGGTFNINATNFAEIFLTRYDVGGNPANADARASGGPGFSLDLVEYEVVYEEWQLTALVVPEPSRALLLGLASLALLMRRRRR